MKALHFGIIALSASFFAATAPTSRAAENPLSAFAGGWSGSGTITTKDGSRERIRCRSNNSESGSTLKLGLRCASDSYKFELQSDVNNSGGNISGSWNETTRGVYGNLSGKLSGGHITASAQAVGFSASLSISSRGGRMSVLIRSPGSEISEVSISMGKSGR